MALLGTYKLSEFEAGCDEAGRGPLAGPVFAAAVILPKDFYHPLLNDSKQVNEKNRYILREVIEKEALAWAVVALDAEKIDEINILNSSILGMQMSVAKLGVRPTSIIIDGNKFKPFGVLEGSSKEFDDIPRETVVKGDAKYANIAAASILAKTYRDDYMREIAKEYPQYGWDENMGYPTESHIEAIRKFGYTKYHRMSFHVKALENRLFDL